MSEHKNGTVYGKYIKVKNGTDGVKQCANYIDDQEKTGLPMEKGETEVPSAKQAIHYIKNNPKTVNPATKKHLVSGHNCSADTAVQEFSLAEKVYHSHKSENFAPGQRPNQAFHIILSYKGTDIDPEIIHEMGCEFARRLCGDEFQAMIATHLNTNNYHNHILVNAYALDGWHKFKDSYHVYKEFRTIVNEISLEYGLPILINDEKENAYKSWKEFIATKEGKSWKQEIICNLNECISLSNSYDDVLKLMQEKGYELQHNPKSITFKKGEAMVRDRRLGYAYTNEGICRSIEQRIKEEYWNKQIKENKERQLQQENYHKNKTFYPIPYIPRYDQYGKRRGIIIRFLMMIKESILNTMDNQKNDLADKAFLSSIELKQAENQVNQLNDAIKTADQYGITNMDVLKMHIRELHAENMSYQNKINNLEDYLENAGKVNQLIERYRKLEPVLTAAGIDKKEIIFIPDSAIIQENRTKLNPMQAKTRSDLFQAIHNSPYRLTRKFNRITETEAHQIIKAIREKQNEHLPDSLILMKKEENKQLLKNHSSHQSISASATKQTAVKLKQYHQETKQAILEFKETADKLASYGLINENEINDFLKNIAEKMNELDLQKSFSNEIDMEIKTLFKLKKTLEQLQLENPILLSKLMTDKAKKDSAYDILQYMKIRLDQLPFICEHELKIRMIPHPDEHRFLGDLRLLYPEKFDISIRNPKHIHYLIAKLKSEQFFEKEMEKELEKKEGQHEKDNIKRG